METGNGKTYFNYRMLINTPPQSLLVRRAVRRAKGVRVGKKENGESFSTFSVSVPRPAFEIIKVGKMWVKRKMQKNTAI